jgi:hypothetical protein
MSYVGGVIAGRVGNLAPTVAGFTLSTAGMLAMGFTWNTDTSHWLMAAQLAVVGAGIGLVLAPSSAALVDAADDANRGTAAGLVIMARLIGFSVGLAALTAWDLRRFNELRDALVLPALGEPGYETALADAAIDITTTALAETFVGAGLALALGWAFTWLLAGGARPAQVDGSGIR